MSLVQIDRYEILAEIGHGGMATVYHAREPEGGDVAIKVLRRKYLTDLGFRARFEREAQTIAALEHPAIVPLLAFGRHEEQPYLVMPYMPGGSLALRLQAGALSPQAAGAILARIAGALDTLHARGVVHGDLKPSNILFDAADRAYLADFGIALQTATGGAGTAVIGGTPAYMSPEQCRQDEEIDGRSDIYSLGATLFHMLTGRPPFSGDTPLAILTQHVLQAPPALHSLNPDLPDRLEPVVDRSLAKEAAARYQTAGALSAAYTRALDPQAAGGDAADVPPEDTLALAPGAQADETPRAASSPFSGAAIRWQPLQARVLQLAEGAMHWSARHFVLALVLVSLLGMLCAVAAIVAIRGPSAFRSANVGLNARLPATRIAFLPLIRSEGPGEEAVPAPTEPAPTPAPNLLLLYSADSVTAINVSNEDISLSGLRFHRPGTAGTGDATFAADEWRQVAGRAVAALSPGSCLQLLYLRGSSVNPYEPPPCASLRGWLATRREERLFFLPVEGVSAFEVQRGGQLVGRCALTDGECRLYVSRP